MQANQQDMDTLVAGLTTKSAKIRALGSAGYSRSQIADFLGIRYQHVRNVLKDASRTESPRVTPAAPTTGMSDVSRPFERSPETAQRITLGKDGEVRIPQAMLNAAGVKEGDALLVRFDDDEIRLYTPAAITRRVQAEVRKYIPEGVSLADELIRERHAEAERELRDD